MSLNLFISASLYPSQAKPQMGLFVEKRFFYLRDYLRQQDKPLNYELYAPIPYVPFLNSAFKQYSDYAKTPRFDIRLSAPIQYIRYLHVPIWGVYSDPYSLAKVLEAPLKKFLDKHETAILVAEYGFPDAYALAILGKKYKLPVVFTARGTDIDHFSRTSMGAWLIDNYGQYINGIVCVSENMRKDVINVGFEEKKTIVIGNGVEHEVFCPQATREAVVKQYRIRTDKIIVSVGGLIDRKRHDLAIEAIAPLKNVTLIIAGEGEKEGFLKQKAIDLECSHRVIFTGLQTQPELAKLYNAADLFLLCSEYEGRANVLLEAASCGTPLLASNVGGSKEIITSDKMGIIFKDHYAPLITDRIQKIFAASLDREFISKQMESFSWEKTAEKYANFLSHFIS